MMRFLGKLIAIREVLFQPKVSKPVHEWLLSKKKEKKKKQKQGLQTCGSAGYNKKI